MMLQEFMDTSALIALSDSNDINHGPAVKHFREASKLGLRFTIGKPVLVEFLDGVTKRIGKDKALLEIEAIDRSQMVMIVDDTGPDWDRALNIFRKYDDKPIDLTDSLSFAIMERFGIDTAFTFDSDFETHGLNSKPVKGLP